MEIAKVTLRYSLSYIIPNLVNSTSDNIGLDIIFG